MSFEYDDDDSDSQLPPCERFSALIAQNSISSYFQCTVCALECIPTTNIQFINSTLIPGIQKILNLPNGAVIESMLTTLPDICDLLVQHFPNEAVNIIVNSLIPDTWTTIERFGEIFTDLCSETLASLLILCPKDTFISSELPIIQSHLTFKKKEVRIIIGHVLLFISNYFPCNEWFDQFYEFINVMASDSLGSVRALVPSIISLYSKSIHEEEQQSKLVGRFQLFCKDKSILVRKSASESLVALSESVTENIRLLSVLPSANILLNDHVEAVRTVILRNLGPLISSIGHGVDSTLVNRFTSALTSTDSNVEFASAFAFPAVALALGKDRWCELKDAFDVAMLSREFRVRKTLSFGFVSFCSIVDENDMKTIVNGFLRDLPAIADGIIQNLHHILSLTKIENIIFCLQDPTTKYNEWRIRLHVSQQCRYCIGIIDEPDLYPIAKELLTDKVAMVRKDAAISYSLLMTDDDSCIHDLQEIASDMSHHVRISAADVLREVQNLSVIKKSMDILRTMIEDEKVPNVRVAAVSAAVNIVERFKESDDTEATEVLDEVNKLLEFAKKDTDIDVAQQLAN
ncbi:hypothetical protein M9Y10_000775 [Tritrichomonas musculus]|uniref:HEAT repeat family protein n=1 Tax=Tritrichomonas musculus TaxID=1915356 RepID=A0ABR2L660_9EUKA